MPRVRSSDSNPSAAGRASAAFLRGPHDRPRERVLRVGFDGRGEREQLVLVDARGGGHGGHDRLAAGERAGLVEDDDVELAGPLEREAVLDEQAVAGARGSSRWR